MNDLETYADAAAAALGLTLAPEHRPGVLRYLQLAASLAPRVMDFELAREDEGANVFRPVEPDVAGATDMMDATGAPDGADAAGAR